MTDGDGTQSLGDRLLSVDPAKTDVMFTVLLILAMVVLLVQTFEYRREAQLFPLLVLTPMFLMLGFLLVIQLSSRVRAFVDKHTSSSAMGSAIDESKDGQSDESVDLQTFRKNATMMITWMLLLLALVYLGGHLIGITVFLFLIYYFYSEQTLLRSVIYTAINVGLIYLLFIEFMSARLYTGIFGF